MLKFLCSCVFFLQFLFADMCFYDPTTTPGGTPNLSGSGNSASDAQIAADSSGKYAYAVWSESNGGYTRIRVALTSNYGDEWTNPTTTTEGTPYLSVNGVDASDAQITTDSSGQYVYAVWVESDGTYTRIRTAFSSNYGDEWTNPSTTPIATPYLSAEGFNASTPQIATDSSGKYVYAVWVLAKTGQAVVRLKLL